MILITATLFKVLRMKCFIRASTVSYSGHFKKLEKFKNLNGTWSATVHFMNYIKSILKYYAAPVQRVGDGRSFSYEEIQEPISEKNKSQVLFWSVYERNQDGLPFVIADFWGDNAKENAEIFALAKLKGQKHFPNGFESWHETHYLIVSNIERALDAEGDDDNLALELRCSHGIGELFTIAAELTDEFERKYENHLWDGEYFDTLDEFITEKLYSNPE